VPIVFTVLSRRLRSIVRCDDVDYTSDDVW